MSILCAAAWLSASACASSVQPEYRLTVWPPHASSPDFRLIDVHGTPRSLADFRGRVVVIFFGFTHCPDACPTQLLKLSMVVKQLGKLGDRVQVLFITLDPQRDVPALLSGYVAAFDSRFMALTGDNTQIQAAAANFFVQYSRVETGSDYTIEHSSSTYLIDAAGRLRLIGGLRTSVRDYVHDLTELAETAPSATR